MRKPTISPASLTFAIALAAALLAPAVPCEAQRGGGLSRTPDPPPLTPTFNRSTADARPPTRAADGSGSAAARGGTQSPGRSAAASASDRPPIQSGGILGPRRQGSPGIGHNSATGRPLVNPRKIVQTDAGMNKVRDFHVEGGKNANLKKKSLFYRSQDVSALIRKAEGTPAFWQPRYGHFQRMVKMDRPIGRLQKTGTPTDVYTVITDAEGNLVNAFPGRPGQLGT